MNSEKKRLHLGNVVVEHIFFLKASSLSLLATTLHMSLVLTASDECL